MAPRKEKTEKVSANEAADTILNYLRKTATHLQGVSVS
jgi:26S proteasome regulatory subunit (ATPase 3-interacting protein)